MENEKRLIDANALMDAFRAYMVERYDRERCFSEENCKTCDRPCLWHRIVSEAPTVDAVEVVHGRWEEHPRMTGYLRCSKCHDANIWEDWLADGKWNYCPNCGAKMDGGNEVVV